MAEIDLRADSPAPNSTVVDRGNMRRPKREKGATAIEVATWIKAGGPKRHGCARSLWLQVTEAGTVSWLIRYRHDGKTRSLGLGAADLSGKAGFTLKAARAKADAALLTLQDRQDPATKLETERVAKRQAEAVAKAAVQKKHCTQHVCAAPAHVPAAVPSP